MKKLTLTLLICLIYLSPNKVLSETMYDLEKREGIYYKKSSDLPFNGKITGNPKGEFKNGKREGVWIWVNKNGQVNTKGNYKNGKEDGTWTTYYNRGYLSDKGEYKKGKKEGVWVSYWDETQLMSKGYYKNGEKEGSWVSYSNNGTLNKKHSGTYKDGELISN